MACVGQGSSPTPFMARPSSSVSQHHHHNLHHHSTTPTSPGPGGGGGGNGTTNLLFPNQNHPEFALRRVEQRLDSLQSQLEKALLSLNGRIDLVLGAMVKKTSEDAASLINTVGEFGRNVEQLSGKTTPVSSPTTSASSTANCSTSSSKGSPLYLSPRRRIGGHPSILKDVSTEKG